MNLEEMADGVARMMGRKLGLRGRDLTAKLRRSRRVLPGHVRAEAALLADAARRARDPRTMAQVDLGRASHAYAQCMAWLRVVNPRERRWHRLLDWAAGLAFQLLLLASLITALILWRGLA